MNDTKQHILKTSFRLFLQKNFKEVTLQDIVKETGLSKGAFYHYFKSKDELFVEVVEVFYLSEEMNNYDKLDKSSLKKFYNSYLEHLQDFVDYLASAFSEDVEVNSPKNINYFTLVFDALDRYPNFKQKTKETQDKELSMWQTAIEKAVNKKEINTKMKSKHVARLFLYSVDATFIHSILEGNLSGAIAEIKALWDSFYQELKR